VVFQRPLGEREGEDEWTRLPVNRGEYHGQSASTTLQYTMMKWTTDGRLPDFPD
jgi:hypothetical protein